MVIKCDTIRQLAYGFLLTSYSNFVSKMHRIRDIDIDDNDILIENRHFSTTPLSFDGPCPVISRKYPHKPYVAGNSDLWSTFLLLIIWVYLHSYLCGGLRKTYVFCKNRTMFKVIQGRWFWYQLKMLMPFPIKCSIITLVLSCTVSEIRQLKGRKIAKIAQSNPPQSHKSLSLGVTPCECFDESYLIRSWNHGAIRWWRNHDASSFHFDTIPAVTDRRTDTSLLQRPDLHIASRG